MKLSEDLLSSMVLELKGSYKIQYHAVSPLHLAVVAIDPCIRTFRCPVCASATCGANPDRALVCAAHMSQPTS